MDFGNQEQLEPAARLPAEKRTSSFLDEMLKKKKKPKEYAGTFLGKKGMEQPTNLKSFSLAKENKKDSFLNVFIF